MLKERDDDVDPLAYEVAKKHVFPVWNYLSEEERTLVGNFLLSPEEGFEKIIKSKEIGAFERALKMLKEEEEVTEGEKALIKMILDYAKRKGWIRGDKEDKYFIWEGHFYIELTDKFLPERFADAVSLRKLRKNLERVRREGKESLFKIIATETELRTKIRWSFSLLEFSTDLVAKVLGKKVKDEEHLTFEEAKKIVDWLCCRCEAFMEECSKVELLREDKKGRKRFFWEKEIIIPVESMLPGSPGDLRKLKKLKKCLLDVKQKGGEKFLEIRAKESDVISWLYSSLSIYRKLASKALGRKVKDGEPLGFEEALEVIDYLIPRWEKFVEEARQKGWVWKDKNGEEFFIWDRDVEASLPERGYFPTWDDYKKLSEIKEYLEELEKKNAQRFLRISALGLWGITWLSWRLDIDPDFASKALERKVKYGEPLSFSEAKKIIEYYIEKGKTPSFL